MSIFLRESEQAGIKACHGTPGYANLYWGMLNRVADHAAQPGQLHLETTSRYGWLRLVLDPQAAAAMSPEDAHLPAAARLSNGECLARNTRDRGRTVAAFSGAPDPLHAASHLHADRSSLVVVHNRERLPADRVEALALDGPGGACCRRLRTTPGALELEESVAGRACLVVRQGEQWSLTSK